MEIIQWILIGILILWNLFCTRWLYVRTYNADYWYGEIFKVRDDMRDVRHALISNGIYIKRDIECDEEDN